MEELPRRTRRWCVLKNWALKPGVLCVGELWTLEAERPLGAAARRAAPRLVNHALSVARQRCENCPHQFISNAAPDRGAGAGAGAWPQI